MALGLSEREWVQTRVSEAKDEIITAIKSLMADLPQGYILTDCDVNIGTVELMGGGKRVYIDGVNITVEVEQSPTSPPSTTAPSTPAP